jgi:hypothetical protein
MVAKISIGKSIRGMLHYNERKVGEKEATLILASGFAGEIEGMDFRQKLTRFEHLTNLKPKVKTNALHISLNFDASEKLDQAKLQQVAISYMDKIGFGDQPFLVYRHDDAAHQHVHIVTTNITASEERIDLHDIGKIKSEPARKAIEQEYNLVKAESKKLKQLPAIKPADPEKAKYGHLPTKRAISNVVTAVTRDYKYTSLAELNAVLKAFNVVAMRGLEHTPMFEKKGLMFSLLDSKGIAIGVPIKASSFYCKPTLRELEKKFAKNEESRKPNKDFLKKRIDQLFGKYNAITQATFQQELQKQQVEILFRQNEQEFIYGVTFIDHQSKTVFNGSDLSRDYSAKALTARFSQEDQPKTYLKAPYQPTSYLSSNEHSGKSYLPNLSPTNYLNDLLGKTQPEGAPVTPSQKKKRRKGIII